MGLLVILRNVFLLCWLFIPMVGTFSFYERGNDWQQHQFSDSPSPFSSGNVWQDQPSWDSTRAFVSENDWQQNPSSDVSSSLYPGNMWQDQPSWDPSLSFHTGHVRQQELFQDPSVTSNSESKWHGRSPGLSPSTRQPGIFRCFSPLMYGGYCAYCVKTYGYEQCTMFCPCR